MYFSACVLFLFKHRSAFLLKLLTMSTPELGSPFVMYISLYELLSDLSLAQFSLDEAESLPFWLLTVARSLHYGFSYCLKYFASKFHLFGQKSFPTSSLHAFSALRHRHESLLSSNPKFAFVEGWKILNLICCSPRCANVGKSFSCSLSPLVGFVATTEKKT